MASDEATAIAYCDADREDFKPGNTNAALAISIVYLCISLAACSFWVYNMYVVKKETEVLREEIDFSGQEKHASVSLTKDVSSGKKDQFPFRSLSAVCVNTGNLSYYPSATAEYPILKNIELTVNKGSFVALMGGSGGGKTTLLDILSGRRTEGFITGEGSILGKPLTELTATDLGDIAYMRQFESYPEAMTVQEFLYYRGTLRGLTHEEAVERTKFCITKVKLESFANRKISALSGGQKRRVGVSQLLLCLPKVLFLDEPTSGLDALSSYEVIQSLRELVENGKGLTVICTIHQPRIELFKMFTNVVVLCQGRIATSADNRTSYHVYTQLSRNLGFPAAKEADIGNPADAVIDVLAKVTPWVKIRLWIAAESREKRYLVDRMMSIAASMKREEKLGLVPVSSKSGKTSSKKTLAVPPGIMPTHEMLFKLFPVWLYNAPLARDIVLMPLCLTVLIYYLLAYGFMDVCGLPMTVCYSACCFANNTFYMAGIFTNYAQSLYDNDNLLKEKLVRSQAFGLFHFLVYSFWGLMMNFSIWIISLPVYVTNGIPFISTVLLACGRVIITSSLTAIALTVLSLVNDPSSTTEVQQMSSNMQVVVAIFTAFNGVSIPYNLLYKVHWFFWLSIEFPGGLVLVQNLLKGQKINCESKQCYSHSANVFVNVLDMEHFETTWLPFVVGVCECFVLWILYFIIIEMRTHTSLPAKKELDDDAAGMRLVGNHDGEPGATSVTTETDQEPLTGDNKA